MESASADNEGELTSTMDNVTPVSSNEEKSDTSDATPTSSTDANTFTTTALVLSDDPISSTSSDPVYNVKLSNIIDSNNLKADVNKSSSTDNESDLLDIANIPGEKITEDVEDLVHDLESLLGEPAPTFVVSSHKQLPNKENKLTEPQQSKEANDNADYVNNEVEEVSGEIHLSKEDSPKEINSGEKKVFPLEDQIASEKGDFEQSNKSSSEPSPEKICQNIENISEKDVNSTDDKDNVDTNEAENRDDLEIQGESISENQDDNLPEKLNNMTSQCIQDQDITRSELKEKDTSCNTESNSDEDRSLASQNEVDTTVASTDPEICHTSAIGECEPEGESQECEPEGESQHCELEREPQQCEPEGKPQACEPEGESQEREPAGDYEPEDEPRESDIDKEALKCETQGGSQESKIESKTQECETKGKPQECETEDEPQECETEDEPQECETEGEPQQCKTEVLEKAECGNLTNVTETVDDNEDLSQNVLHEDINMATCEGSVMVTAQLPDKDISEEEIESVPVADHSVENVFKDSSHFVQEQSDSNTVPESEINIQENATDIVECTISKTEDPITDQSEDVEEKRIEATETVDVPNEEDNITSSKDAISESDFAEQKQELEDVDQGTDENVSKDTNHKPNVSVDVLDEPTTSIEGNQEIASSPRILEQPVSETEIPDELPEQVQSEGDKNIQETTSENIEPSSQDENIKNLSNCEATTDKKAVTDSDGENVVTNVESEIVNTDIQDKTAMIDGDQSVNDINEKNEVSEAVGDRLATYVKDEDEATTEEVTEQESNLENTTTVSSSEGLEHSNQVELQNKEQSNVKTTDISEESTETQIEANSESSASVMETEKLTREQTELSLQNRNGTEKHDDLSADEVATSAVLETIDETINRELDISEYKAEESKDIAASITSNVNCESVQRIDDTCKEIIEGKNEEGTAPDTFSTSNCISSEQEKTFDDLGNVKQLETSSIVLEIEENLPKHFDPSIMPSTSDDEVVPKSDCTDLDPETVSTEPKAIDTSETLKDGAATFSIKPSIFEPQDENIKKHSEASGIQKSIFDPPSENEVLEKKTEPKKNVYVEPGPLELSEESDEEIPTLQLETDSNGVDKELITEVNDPKDNIDEKSEVEESTEEVVVQEFQINNVPENLETILAVANLQNIEVPKQEVSILTDKERREMEALRMAVESITEPGTTNYDNVDDIVEEIDASDDVSSQTVENIVESPDNLKNMETIESSHELDQTMEDSTSQENLLADQENLPTENININKCVDSSENGSELNKNELEIQGTSIDTLNLDGTSDNEHLLTLAQTDIGNTQGNEELKCQDSEINSESTKDMLNEDTVTADKGILDSGVPPEDVTPDSSETATDNEATKEINETKDKVKPIERSKRHKKSSDSKIEELSINVDVTDKDKSCSPKITIKPIKVPDEEVSTTSNSDSEIGKGTLKMTITKQSNKMHTISKMSDSDAVEPTPELEEPLPKLKIKSKVSVEPPQKMATRSSKQTATTSNQRSGSPRITIKPVVKPEKQEHLSPLKIKIGLKSDEGGKKHSPKLNIKPIAKQEEEQPKEPCQSPRKVLIKPLVKSVEETETTPRITIKPIPKPELEKESSSVPQKLNIKPIKKPEEEETESEKERSSPKITIKPIVKPSESEVQDEEVDDEVKQRIVLKINKGNIPSKDNKKKEHTQEEDKSEKLAKITVKISKEGGHHIVQQAEESQKRPHEDINPQEKNKKQKVEPESIISTRSKHKDVVESTVETRSKHKEATPIETRSKHKEILVESSTEAVKMKHKEVLVDPVESKIKDNPVSPGMKHKDPIHESPVEPKKIKLREIKQKENVEKKNEDEELKIVENKIDSPIVISEDSRSQDSGSCIIIDDSSRNTPVSDITENIKPAVEPTPNPIPRKRGRPRKVPLEVRQEFKEQEEPSSVEPKVESTQSPPVHESGRPKRSCRGQSALDTLGLKPRKPRGPGRGRGSARGMGTRAIPMKPEKSD